MIRKNFLRSPSTKIVNNHDAAPMISPAHMYEILSMTSLLQSAKIATEAMPSRKTS